MKTEIKTDSFEGIVRSIANDYINSILFVDERAFNPGPSHETNTNYQKALDVAAVSKAFSKAGKLCGFYAPKTSEDIEECKRLVLKPDIVVLDWDIDIKGKKALSKEEELEDDETDDRGYYSLQLLKCIAEDANTEKLKVVFIYTGESSIDGILLDIEKKLGASFHRNDERFEIDSDNVHVIVRLKPESKVSLAGFDRFIVSYENLPDEVLSCFADYVRGLMPCFAMRSIAKIRESSAKILKVFHRGLDAEFLAHQMALDDPDYAQFYIAHSFGSAISELILNDSNINTDLWTEAWIDSNCNVNKSVSIVQQSLAVSPKTVKDFFKNRYLKNNVTERVNDAFSVSCSVHKEKKLISSLSSLFHKEGDQIDQAKYDFAALSHKKNLFSESTVKPILTLGTIIKHISDGRHYLCIQQRCDTRRVSHSGMGFLFLPLLEDRPHNTIGAIAFLPGKNLYLKQSSKDAVMIFFSAKQDGKPIIADKEGDKFLFRSKDDIYEWEAELKDLIAQRYVAEYTSHLSRVAIDEAEWLRVEGMSD